VKLMLTGGTVLTMNPQRETISDGTVVIDGDKITEVGTTSALREKYRDYKVLDVTGKYVIPGLINTHTHLFQGLLKGLGDDRALVDWFRKATGPSATQLTPEDCSLAAKLGALESLHSGATCLVDFMYAHHQAGLSDGIIQALGASGLRSVFARGYMDYGVDDGVPPELIESYADALADTERLFDQYDGCYDGRMHIWLAPCMIWTQTKEGLIECVSLSRARGIPMSMHVSETQFELENSMRRFGKKDLAFLESIGFLGPNVLAVHCVWSDSRDIRIMKYYDVKVSHNAVSNMYLASGVAPIPQMVMAGITVGLATDGPASNNNQSMLATLKWSSLLHKVAGKDPTVMTADKVMEMATIEGAKAVGMETEVGSLERGKKADLVVLDLATPFTTPVLQPVSTMVYAAVGDEADTVIINGEIVMESKTVLTMNESEVLEQAQVRAESLSRRAKTSVYRERPWRALAF
jgi:5-methylthioadenosine/S-adenosylhomocysteine deaminase